MIISLGFLSGSETGLLAGGGVLGVEYARAPEQVESRFHNNLSERENSL